MKTRDFMCVWAFESERDEALKGKGGRRKWKEGRKKREIEWKRFKRLYAVRTTGDVRWKLKLLQARSHSLGLCTN